MSIHANWFLQNISAKTKQNKSSITISIYSKHNIKTLKFKYNIILWTTCPSIPLIISMSHSCSSDWYPGSVLPINLRSCSLFPSGIGSGITTELSRICSPARVFTFLSVWGYPASICMPTFGNLVPIWARLLKDYFLDRTQEGSFQRSRESHREWRMANKASIMSFLRR